MKISTFIIFILIIAGVFFTFAQMSMGVNQQFPESPLNSSEWENQYNYIEDINDTFAPLQEAFNTIQDENAGWFSKLSEGITAIPYALLIVPQAVFGSLFYGGNIIVSFFTLWALPTLIVTLGLVLLSIWGIFKLIEYYNKTDI